MPALPTTGNVVPATVTLLSGLFFEPTSGGWGKLKGTTLLGAIRFYNLEVDALGRLMVKDGTGSGRHLTHTAKLQAAITGGSPNVDGSGNYDGSFTDASNALEGGDTVSYRVVVDNLVTPAHWIHQAV